MSNSTLASSICV